MKILISFKIIKIIYMNKPYTTTKLFLFIFICLVTLGNIRGQESKQAHSIEESTTKNALHEGSNRLSPKLGVPFTINRTNDHL